MTPAGKFLCGHSDIMLWCFGLLVTFYAAMVWWPAAHFQGHAIPMGHDSYYHAVRVMDAVSRGSVTVFVFDPMMHTPEGNWVNWPWAYDGLLALVTLTGQSISGGAVDELLIMAPLVWIPVNLTLLLVLARQLELSTATRIALVLAWSLHPLVQAVHGVGMLDHHQTEMAMFLATCCAWLAWIRRPERSARAFLAGFVPAVAPALHTSLFLCQPAVALAAFFLWINHSMPGICQARWVLLGAVIGGLTAVLPAPIAEQHTFAYHTLSWFHLGIAVLTALGVCLLSVLPSHSRTVALICIVLTVLVGLALPFIYEAAGYIFGTEGNVSEMMESRSYVLGWIWGDVTFLDFVTYYGPWALLLPLTLAWTVCLGFRSQEPGLRIVSGFSLFGLFLLCGQFRFHPFGIVFLLLMPLLAIDRLSPRYAPRLQKLVPAMALVLALPGLPLLLRVPDTGLNDDYPILAPLYARVSQSCSDHAAVVLADQNDGHYLRYIGNCAVVANNFLVDTLAREKAAQWRELMRDAADGKVLPAWLDFVFVRVKTEDLTGVSADSAGPARISLLSGEPPAGQLQLLWESPARITVAGESVPLARFFAVSAAVSPEHPEGSVPAL